MNFLSVIATLFGASSPAAVPWFIVAIWIGITVEASVWRARSHVLQKQSEIVPSLAELYVAPTVVLPCSIFWIAAACACVIPAQIFACVSFAVCSMVAWLSFARRGVCGQYFATQTAATLSWSFSLWRIWFAAEIAAFNDRCIAAITKAFPFWFLRNDWKMSSQYQQPTYAFSS